MVNLELFHARFPVTVFPKKGFRCLTKLQPRLEYSRFSVLGYCMQNIRKEKPADMQDLCRIKEEICNKTPPDIRHSKNIDRRVQFCIDSNGGHIQNML